MLSLAPTPDFSTVFIPQLSIDCVIFGYQNGQLYVLVPKLIFGHDLWALPGGFIRQTEGIDQAARRILAGRTSLTDIYLEQFRVFGAPDRSNRYLIEQLAELKDIDQVDASWLRGNREWLSERFVSLGYYALVDMEKVKPVKTEIDAALHWCPLLELPEMILDHREIVAAALIALRLNFDRKLIGFNLLPEKFTMRELRELYEAIFERPFARNNFQKKMLDLNVLERLEKRFTGAANKAPYLYRFHQPSGLAEIN